MSKTATQPAFVSQTFRDCGWKIRTLIMPDGTALQVNNYQVTAHTPEQLAFLQAQAGLSPVAADVPGEA